MPGTTLVDESALERIFALHLVESYPHSTLAVIEDAGHALMHERPDLVASLLVDWLDRAVPMSAASAA